MILLRGKDDHLSMLRSFTPSRMIFYLVRECSVATVGIFQDYLKRAITYSKYIHLVTPFWALL